MNASTQPVTRIDYGAGSLTAHQARDEQRTEEVIVELLGHFSLRASKHPFSCLLLFKLIRSLRPSSCIEMGTAVGVSAAYQAAALHLNEKGTLVTLEGAAPFADIATENFRRLSLDTVEVAVGRFTDTLPVALARHQPVDYVFVDGHHEELATLAYFEQILSYLAPTALLVFDDIEWSEGMKRVWSTIAQDPRVGIAVDCGSVGLCVIDRTITRSRYFSVPLQYYEWRHDRM